MLEQGIIGIVRPHIVAAGGVLPTAAARVVLRETLAGSQLTDAQLEELLDAPLHQDHGSLREAGEQVVDVPTLAPRMRWTHRMSADEIDGDVLDLDPDLAVLGILAGADGGLYTPDGTPLRLEVRRRRRAGPTESMVMSHHLHGPDGWLRHLTPGAVVVARADRGFLHLDPHDGDLDPADDVLERLPGLVDVANHGDRTPAFASEVQLLVALDDGETEAPRRLPFGELCAAAGLDVYGVDVARPEWWERHREVTDMVRPIVRFKLEDGEVRALHAALKVADGGPASPSVTAGLARHWPAAEATFDELRHRRVGPDAIDAVGARIGGAAGTWIRSRAAELAGDGVAAQKLLDEARAADRTFGPAVADQAEVALLANRTQEAFNLLHLVRLPGDDELEDLRELLDAERPTCGRNDPCPCGSGRKYKQCHLGRSLLDDHDRAMALLDKATAFVLRTADPDDLADVDQQADDDGNVVMLGHDLLLFEHGGLDRFFATWQHMLPEPERTWVARWVDGHRPGLYRVCDEQPDIGGLLVDDVTTGERFVLDDGAIADDLSPARLVWMRLLPLGDRWTPTGVALVLRLSERERVLASRPSDPLLARLEAIAGRAEPARMTNTSGEPLVLCRAVVDPGVDAGDVIAAMDAALGHDDRGDGTEWSTATDTPGMERAMTAGFALEDGRLVVTTNSLARHDAALHLVREVFPGLRVVEDDRDLWSVLRARADEQEAAEAVVHALTGRSPAQDLANDEDRGPFGAIDVDSIDLDTIDFDDDLDFDDEEDEDDEDDLDDVDDVALAGAVAELRRRHDERWLDTALPVLGGHTPREAAADPVLRADLLTVMAETRDAGGEDDSFLRAELGL